jgi:hypothetical protein
MTQAELIAKRLEGKVEVITGGNSGIGHDEIYKNSKGENVAWVTKDILKQFASNVNIPNIKKFSECLDSQNHSNIVEQNDNLASSIGYRLLLALFYYQQGNHSNNPYL